jgi:uncharacterized RDD family membrane protein YckC
MTFFKSRFLPPIEPIYLTLLATLLVVSAATHAQSTTTDAAPDAPASAAISIDEPVHASRHHRHNNDLVSIGHGSTLRSGERADSVVSVLGSSTSEGDADSVVSVFGNTRVTGPLSDSAVAVLGNTYIDSTIDGDAVAVLGNVELGPNAQVGGDVVAVGGIVKRDPAAIVHGDVQSIAGSVAGFGWLQPWIENCLFYGRPLAFAHGLGWAWRLALACLGLYIGIALLFRPALTHCVQTMEAKPGMTVLAALLSLLAVPVLLVLLCITVIGIAAVPFILFALLCLGFFGKAVMLAWLGRRCMGANAEGARAHPAFAVLVGGLIVLVFYLVPVLGFVVFKLLGLMGLGVVVYTLVLTAQAHRAAKDAELHAHSATPAPSPTPTPSATPPFAAVARTTPAAPATSSPEALATSSATGATAAAGASPAAGATPAASAAAASSAAGAEHSAGAPRAAAAPAVTAALPRAGFWIRMVALLLDSVLVGIVLGVLHHSHNVELVALAAYGAIMWKMRGATIGGTVFDLHVVRLDGRPVDWETAIIRALGCFLSLAIAGLGFFWIAFDHGKQAWHDKIAGTVVVRVAHSH